eukprot:1853519-Pyramimonas_sp.AAC.1
MDSIINFIFAIIIGTPSSSSSSSAPSPSHYFIINNIILIRNVIIIGTPCLLYTSDAADDTPCVDL